MRNAKHQSERERRRMERHERQEERVADAGTCCQFCGEDNPVCLQVHHIAGRTNDMNAVVCVCQNCHAKLSDKQQDYGPHLLSHKQPRTRKQWRIAMLRGISDCISLCSDKLSEVADEIEFEGDEDNE